MQIDRYSLRPFGDYVRTVLDRPTLTPVETSKPLKKKLDKKTPKMQEAVLRCIRQLRIDWQHPGLRAKKLSSTDNFEVRVSQGDRLTFIWDGPKIVITNHCHHDILKRGF